MSNRRTQFFGGRAAPFLRSPGRGGGTVVLLALLGMLASVLPATAAEIVEVRVGRHPTFTRVVFELDRAAGYRIERSDPTSDVAELIVSLDATSIPRKVRSQMTLIEQVEVEPSGSRSVARVRLAKEGLRLKEMILASPPRIVLDVLSDAPPVAKSKTAKPAPTPVRTEPSRAPSQREDAEPPIAERGGKPEAVPARRPEPELAQAPKPAPAPKPAQARKPTAAPKPEPRPARMEESEPIAAPEEPADDDALFDEDPQLAAAGSAAGRGSDAGDLAGSDDLADAASEANAREAGDFGADETALADAMPPRPVDPTPARAPQPQQPRRPRPMVAQPEPVDEGLGWMTWALAGVGAIVLIAGGLFVARRRGAGGDEDSSEFFSDVGETPEADDTNPFGTLDAETQEVPLASPDATTASPLGMEEEETTVMSFSDDEDKEETESAEFGGSQETGMDDMEVISREQVNESLGGAMPPVGGVPEEFQQLMAEMQRRMEALEARCDELVDARDRLERQVAAQTEELRVQRAAIARTQRAVRNLGRPEDADEHEATEPALRDPQ